MGLFLLFATYKLWSKQEQIKKETIRKDNKVLWRRRVITQGNVNEYEISLLGLLFSQMASFFSGVVTGLFGIGGGAVDTTIMILIGVPPQIATAIAIFGMTLTESAGVISHYLLGNLILEYAIPMAIGATIGGQVGPKISKKIKPLMLRRILSITAFLIGLRMMIFCII